MSKLGFKGVSSLHLHRQGSLTIRLCCRILLRRGRMIRIWLLRKLRRLWGSLSVKLLIPRVLWPGVCRCRSLKTTLTSTATSTRNPWKERCPCGQKTPLRLGTPSGMESRKPQTVWPPSQRSTSRVGPQWGGWALGCQIWADPHQIGPFDFEKITMRFSLWKQPLWVTHSRKTFLKGFCGRGMSFQTTLIDPLYQVDRCWSHLLELRPSQNRSKDLKADSRLCQTHIPNADLWLTAWVARADRGLSRFPQVVLWEPTSRRS